MDHSVSDPKRSPSLDEKDRPDEEKASIEESGETNLASAQLHTRTPSLSRHESKKDEEKGSETVGPTSNNGPEPATETRWLTGSKLLIVHSAMLLSYVYATPPISR